MKKIKEKTLFQEVAESVLKELEVKEINERMGKTRTNTLELGLDVKILPPPSGDCGLINKRDNDGLFPVDKFEIYVWESDDEPVFHVKGYGWDIVFNYTTGELHGIVSAGTDVEFFNYVRNNIVGWMKQDSNICKKITNSELIHLTWGSLN